MKAIVYERYGRPDVLEMREVAQPVPGEREVLVKVHATSVNRTDCHNLSARPLIMRFTLGLFKPSKTIPGTEFAGEVVQTGEAVSALKVGDRVFGFDDQVAGSYAEYLAIREDQGIATIPGGLSWQEAAAGTEGFHYAYNFVNKVKLNAGDRVLVNGASGGIGSALTQLLRHMGARITAVCDTHNIELVKTLGAERVLDYTKEDFTGEEVQYDFVFDAVGKSAFLKCRPVLKPGGVYISSELGRNAENVLYSVVTAVAGHVPGQDGRKVLFPFPPDIRRSVLLRRRLIEEGAYQSVIDRSYALTEISDAFRYVEKGQKTGNVAIDIT